MQDISTKRFLQCWRNLAVDLKEVSVTDESVLVEVEQEEHQVTPLEWSGGYDSLAKCFEQFEIE